MTWEIDCQAHGCDRPNAAPEDFRTAVKVKHRHVEATGHDVDIRRLDR